MILVSHFVMRLASAQRCRTRTPQEVWCALLQDGLHGGGYNGQRSRPAVFMTYFWFVSHAVCPQVIFTVYTVQLLRNYTPTWKASLDLLPLQLLNITISWVIWIFTDKFVIIVLMDINLYAVLLLNILVVRTGIIQYINGEILAVRHSFVQSQINSTI